MGNDSPDKDKQLSDLVSLMAEGEKNADSSRAYSRFKARIEAQSAHSGRRNSTWLYAAAVLIPFLFLSYFTYQYFKASAGEWHGNLTVSEVVVPNGSKTQLLLQDGTKVWINSGSSVQCAEGFGKKNREIKLCGEAYLEVAHNDKCPFIVSTGEVKVKVLGTRFNVNAYKENEEIKVALLEGSVEMSVPDKMPLLLPPKSTACYNPVSKQTRMIYDTMCDSVNWISNKLIFDGESFEQIVLTLERNFNVKIHIHNAAVKERRFVGDFVNNETIEQIFNVMSSDGKFKYKIKGNVIDVY